MVHLTPERNAGRIERSGVRSRTVNVWTGVDRVETCKGLYAVPLTADFQVTHQWLRELRQWNGRLRMCAVNLKVPDEYLVWVGRYSKPKVQATAAEAAALFATDPWGNEVIVPGNIASSAVQVRSIRQDVGWQDQPDGHWDCVCPVCLAPGHPKFMRRINAVYEEALRSGDLGGAEMSLERARGRLSVERLLRHQTRNPAGVAQLLHWFKWPEVVDTALALLRSEDVAVRVASTQSILRSLPVAQAFAILPKNDVDVMAEFCDWVPWLPDPLPALPLLSQLQASENSTIAACARESRRTISLDQAG